MKTLACLIALAVPLAWAQSCPPEGTQYYPDAQYCDRYAQCRDGVPSEEQCPDGLLFDDTATEGRHPCAYPADVDCGKRTKTQPAQPTENCPHQWGYFGSGSSSECGYFYNCVGGLAHLFTCPPGLAFSSATYRCEYPDEAPDCDAEEYLGFSCPSESAVPYSGGNARYRSPRDCRQFFHCVGASPRLGSCPLGEVFSEATGGCEDPEGVSGCDDYYPREELEAIRARKAKEAERRARRRQQLLGGASGPYA